MLYAAFLFFIRKAAEQAGEYYDRAIAVGVVRLSVFGYAGVISAQVIAFGLLIGAVGFTGAFLARAFVERLPIRVHTAIVDSVVLFGGAIMVYCALTR